MCVLSHEEKVLLGTISTSAKLRLCCWRKRDVLDFCASGRVKSEKFNENEKMI